MSGFNSLKFVSDRVAIGKQANRLKRIRVPSGARFCAWFDFQGLTKTVFWYRSEEEDEMEF
jgi:hypothetical protein